MVNHPFIGVLIDLELLIKNTIGNNYIFEGTGKGIDYDNDFSGPPGGFDTYDWRRQWHGDRQPRIAVRHISMAAPGHDRTSEPRRPPVATPSEKLRP